ncbi:uncharacterized protein CDAR_259291 [Caerostris darwini]|uniref:Uncharacterized protein n=1 Tax=Caerostris darwini TaxID=1538125 RepID=A0AAV4WU76_9ARAC|nr:uncharacterized protein CDAR_259291 [Caerostris darwini]
MLKPFSADAYNKKFKRINIIFKNKSNNCEESDDSCSVQSISKRKFNLSLLELKKFGGEIKDWLPFRGQLSKINTDPNIDEADKLQYLIHTTLPSTRAREDQKVKHPTLYVRIETPLRALEVATEKYAAMVFPLVESCLSEEVIRAWQRNNS